MSEQGLPQEKELTPEQKLKRKLKYSINQYRIAVRWLRDARIYKQSFADKLAYNGQPWQAGPEAELADDAQKAYDEAVKGILYWRRQIDECNDKLMDLAGEKINARKRAG